MAFYVNVSKSGSKHQSLLEISNNGQRARKNDTNQTFTRTGDNTAVCDQTGVVYTWDSADPNRPKRGDIVSTSTGNSFEVCGERIKFDRKA